MISVKFRVETQVRLECGLSLIIDLILLEGRCEDGSRGVTARLDDIDFENDLCISSHKQSDMRES